MKARKKLTKAGIFLFLMIAAAMMTVVQGSAREAKAKWAVYMYMCGSDLESEYGCASTDIEEMISAKLPKGVQYVIQTGGAKKWKNKLMNAKKLGRYVYDQKGLRKVGTSPLASMGEKDTLVDFLKFCEKKYPAEHAMVVLWNHGGGSLYGAEFDELFEFDSLTLEELNDAFEAAVEARKKKYDIIGFDACLMASVETASLLQDSADYMIASEEVEPGCGWYYKGISSALKKPSISPEKLGKRVCNSFVKGCRQTGEDDEITLSLLDLSKMELLDACLDYMSLELINADMKDPMAASSIMRSARMSENYGGNNDAQGYYNMMDLGDFVKNCSGLEGSKELVPEILNELVVYKVNGPYRSKSTGLSIFFPYNRSQNEVLDVMWNITANPLYVAFQKYIQTGKYPENLDGYIDDTVASLNEFLQTNEKDVFSKEEIKAATEKTMKVDFTGELKIQTDGNKIYTQIPKEEMASLQDVYFNLFILDDENKIMLKLGSTNLLSEDWNNGYFETDFENAWGAIDGNLLFMERTYSGANYNLYSVPILLNGKECAMKVVYDYAKGYQILGVAETSPDESEGAERSPLEIKPGDEIVPIFYACDLSEGAGYKVSQVRGTPFKFKKKSVFADAKIGDGDYCYQVEAKDLAGNIHQSKFVRFSYKDGQKVIAQ